MILPEILSESEEGFADLVFAITADHVDADGGRCFDVQAIHDTEIVGLSIELSPGWKFRQMGDLPCFSGIITYRSSGELGDRFVAVLDRLYGTELDPRRMNEAISFAAITLGDDPAVMDSELVHVKMFYEQGDEAQYAEIYTNFDLPRGVIQIREKDPHYRRAIVRAISLVNG